MVVLSTYVVSVDSRDRDVARFPGAGHYDVALPRRYTNVERVELLEAAVPTTFYVYDASNTSVLVKLVDGAGTVAEEATVTIPAGNYTSSTLVAAFQTALNAAFTPDMTAAVDPATLELSLSSAGGYEVLVDTTTAVEAQTEWGLGYYLGFEKNAAVQGAPLIAPRPVNPNPVTYVFLDIDPFNHIDATGAGTKVAFAKIPVGESNSITYMNHRTSAFAANDLQNPLGKVSKLTVTWKRYDGRTIDFQGYEHSFTLRLLCRDRVPAHGGSCVTGGGRVNC